MMMQFIIGVLSLLLIFNVPAWAEPKAEQAHILVSEHVQNLLLAIEKSKADTSFTDSQKIALVDAQLGDVVDFKRIARRVMAKHVRGATQEQKQRFLKVFRSSLLNTYAKGLWEFNDYKVNILPLKEANQTLRNTQVGFEVITSGGQVFPVIQSLYFNKKTNGWLVQNVIINGINMGLLFREQFARLVAQNNADIGLAIDAWSSEISQKDSGQSQGDLEDEELE